MAIQVNDPWKAQGGYAPQIQQAFAGPLHQLAQHKMQQMQMEKQAQSFRQLGIDPAVASLPPEQQNAFMQNYFKSYPQAGMQQDQDPFAQAYQGLSPAHQQKFSKQTGYIPQPKQPGSQERPLSPKEQMEVNKETLPTYQETIKSYKAANDSERALNRMEQLIKTGKLAGPLKSSFLKTLSHGIFGFGIDLHGLLTNPESQEFNKLSQSFVKNAKNIFGSRITDNDLNSFMQTVPTLLQSDEGKRRIIRNMRIENKAAKLRKDAMDHVIKQNRGLRPRDLEQRIDALIGPQLDELSADFVRGEQ